MNRINAVVYRVNNGFDHFKVFLSVGVMNMVRSDMASSGVTFTLDTESGFHDVVFITGAYGLGENLVQGKVDPDEFYVHKPTFLAVTACPATLTWAEAIRHAVGQGPPRGRRDIRCRVSPRHPGASASGLDHGCCRATALHPLFDPPAAAAPGYRAGGTCHGPTGRCVRYFA